ncbi:hypothetical protein DAEQUDRAFT_32521 [Daedalea quercina L-15889]|uniref:Fungal N-terminal domain-containing protein n=1 Tax=Daedalea quercina L-15889 TaxID=1314783 RepID=A0A165SR13_9APHY|nr:hypothetical protein DAEQUDRAFT_32521 [Daedalea quercina L-15889]
MDASPQMQLRLTTLGLNSASHGTLSWYIASSESDTIKVLRGIALSISPGTAQLLFCSASMTSTLGIGDFITIASILSDLYVALTDARGSIHDYETTVKETERFLTDLNIVKRVALRLSLSRDMDSELAESIINKVDAYKAATERFLQSVQKYEKTFGAHPRKGCILLRVLRKIDWRLRRKSAASEYRQRLLAACTSLNTTLLLSLCLSPSYIQDGPLRAPQLYAYSSHIDEKTENETCVNVPLPPVPE